MGEAVRVHVAGQAARIADLESKVAALTKPAPRGYEHFTPATIEAIRQTCSTQANRAGQTQDEVFKTRGTP
jgi:hypothetical protein